MVRTSRDPRSFGRVCDIMYVVIGMGCILTFVLSWWGTGTVMKGFPVLFFLAALLNFLTACLKFRKDGRRRNQKLQGIFFLLITLGLLALSYVSAVCIWRV